MEYGINLTPKKVLLCCHLLRCGYCDKQRQTYLIKKSSAIGYLYQAQLPVNCNGGAYLASLPRHGSLYITGSGGSQYWSLVGTMYNVPETPLH